MRLNQFLAAAGLGSRRSCERLIREGLVSVNGKRISSLATQVKSEDKVFYQGHEIKTKLTKRYYIFHKPVGVVCSKRGEGSYRSLYELLPPELHTLFYVGRLDADSEGLLLLTDDGYWAQHLLHPRYKVDKVYRVTLDRRLEDKDSEQLLKGTILDRKRVRFKSIYRLKGFTIEVILNQGLKRQIRRQLFQLGYKVKRLIRVKFGSISLNALPIRHYRPLTFKEIQALKAP